MKNSSGIDYFPISVDFFDDDKLASIKSEFGYKGLCVAVRLLCKVYKFDGYYCNWGRLECLLFSESLGAEFSSNLVDEIVRGLVRCGLFDKSVFDSFSVLTSRGIQLRYFEAVKRRRRICVVKEYLLVDVSKISNVVVRSLTDVTPVATSVMAPMAAPVETVVEKGKQDGSLSSSQRRQPEPSVDEEEERLQIVSYFMFERNFYQPNKQFERLMEWNNVGGRSWDSMSHAQRVSASKLWQQQGAKGREETRNRFDPTFLSVWRKIYERSVALGVSVQTRTALLSDRLSFRLGVRSRDDPNVTFAALTCTKPVYDFFSRYYESDLAEIFRPLLDGQRLFLLDANRKT